MFLSYYKEERNSIRLNDTALPSTSSMASQVLPDSTFLDGKVSWFLPWFTLVSSSSCLLRSSSCWVRTCLPLVSCEIRAAFSSTWWLSSPGKQMWAHVRVWTTLSHGAVGPRGPAHPHHFGSAASPSACSGHGLTVSVGHPWP